MEVLDYGIRAKCSCGNLYEDDLQRIRRNRKCCPACSLARGREKWTNLVLEKRDKQIILSLTMLEERTGRKLDRMNLRMSATEIRSEMQSVLNTWNRVMKRLYRNKCVISGSPNICIHHLDAVGINPKAICDIYNGVAISKELHTEFHSQYDQFSGTCVKEDFEEFYFSKTGHIFIQSEHLDLDLLEKHYASNFKESVNKRLNCLRHSSHEQL